jgi:dUTPase
MVWIRERVRIGIKIMIRVRVRVKFKIEKNTKLQKSKRSSLATTSY